MPISYGFRTALTFEVPTGYADVINVEIEQLCSQRDAVPYRQIRIDVAKGVLFEKWDGGEAFDLSPFTERLTRIYGSETCNLLCECASVAINWFCDTFASVSDVAALNDVELLESKMSDCSGGAPHNIAVSCHIDYWQA